MARAHRYDTHPHVTPDPLRYPSPMSRLLRLLLSTIDLIEHLDNLVRELQRVSQSHR